MTERSWKWFGFAPSVKTTPDSSEFWTLLDCLDAAIDAEQYDLARKLNEDLASRHQLTLTCVAEFGWHNARFLIAPVSTVRFPGLAATQKIRLAGRVEELIVHSPVPARDADDS